MQDESAKKIPILVYANKQDLGEAMKSDDIIQELNIFDNSKQNPKALVHVQECACKGTREGEGL